MIFVILGFIILLASFLIALVSLWREKKRVSKRSSKLDQASAEVELPSKSEVSEEVTIEAVDKHFPWEVPKDPIASSDDNKVTEHKNLEGVILIPRDSADIK